MSAGIAATGASFLTSRFGVAGTLLGAGLTAMIVTGATAILRAYLESLSGRVRQVPKKMRSIRDRQTVGGPGATMPGRSDLRDNFVGRMRAALDWFSHLPTLRRRSILMRGLAAAAVALVLCLVLIWGTEKLIGNSLSCGLWGECPYGAVPGFHPLGYGGTGAGSSLSGGAIDTGTRPNLLDRATQNGGNPFGGGGQPVFGADPGGGASSAAPDPTASPAPDQGSSAPPDQGSSAPPAGAGQQPPASASPAPGQQDAPSSASPAAGQ